MNPDECISFGNLLHEILNHHIKLTINDDIETDYYSQQRRQTPKKINFLVHEVLKRKKCHNRVENSVLGAGISQFTTTPLIDKICYIEAATQSTYQGVVTTEEYVSRLPQGNHQLLTSVTGLSFESVCNVI